MLEFRLLQVFREEMKLAERTRQLFASRAFLNDKLIVQKTTGRVQTFLTTRTSSARGGIDR